MSSPCASDASLGQESGRDHGGSNGIEIYQFCYVVKAVKEDKPKTIKFTY